MSEDKPFNSPFASLAPLRDSLPPAEPAEPAAAPSAPSDREKWLKELKASLGCGGVVEGEALMLQGDHRKRLPEILTRRGVKRVIIG